MKKITFLFAFFVSISTFSQWSDAGSISNSGAGSFRSVIEADSNGKLYLAYRHSNQKAAVMEYNGTTWVTVGTTDQGFSDGAIGNIDLEFDNNNVPFVVYEDWNNGFKITMKKFNGTDWEDFSKAFTPVKGVTPILAFDSNNTPFVGFVDTQLNSSGNGSVMKYNGTSWEFVGARYITGVIGYMDFALDTNNIPYICYSLFESGNGGKTSVQKFNGTSWEFVGAQNINTAFSEFHNIVIDKTNALYISFKATEGTGGNLKVYKFNGTSWDNLENAGFTYSKPNEGLLVDDSNNLYIISKPTNSSNANMEVKKWNNTSWDIVGGTPIQPSGDRQSITKANGTLYLNYWSNPLLVQKHQEATASVNEFAKEGYLLSLYPNPAKIAITISLENSKNIDKIEFYNLLGKKVISKTFKNQSTLQINISQVSKGVYMIKAYTDKETISKKIIIN